MRELEYGRNLSCVADKMGRLPLHLAAIKGRDDAMGVLLEYTPATHYEAKDVDGRTPLWYASYYYKGDYDWGCDFYRYDDCEGKIQRKMESMRGVGPRYYYAFAAVVVLVGLAIIFRSAITSATVNLGRGLYMKTWRWGEIGWRWGVIAWPCVGAGAAASWQSMRDEYLKSNIA